MSDEVDLAHPPALSVQLQDCVVPRRGCRCLPAAIVVVVVIVISTTASLRYTGQARLTGL